MKKIFLSLLAAAFTCTLSAQSGICLTFTANLSSGNNPRSLVTADFNNDGNTDIVSANHGMGNSVSVFFGNGNGTFSSATTYTMGSNPRITKGDFNKDGFMDIATANEGTCCGPALTIRLNNGNGTFGAVSSYTAGSPTGSNQPQSVISNDFNADGNPDIALINLTGITLSVFLGNGTGGFAPCVNYPVATGGVLMISDHFNNDPYADIAISNGSGTVAVLYGSGPGTFSPATNYTFNGSSNFFMTTGDFNGDGRKDIASAGGLLLGSASGTFTPAGNFNISGGWGVAAADFDSDGFADLAVNTSSNQIHLLNGLGNGNFGQPVILTSSTWAAEMASADLNNDSKPDLAACDGLGTLVQIFLNKSFFLNASSTTSVSCNPFTTTLSASSSMNSYAWSNGATSSSIVVTALTNTVYTVSSSSAGCTATKTLALMVGTPTLFVIASNTIICLGSAVSMSVFGASTYSWNTGATSSSLQVAPFTNTVYQVTGTNAFGCSSSATIGIAVNAVPVLNATSSSPTVCAAGTVSLSASGAVNYMWSNGLTGNLVQVTPATSACYTVMGTNMNGCSGTATVCVNVFPLPALSILGNTTVCLGTSTHFTASGAASYSWSTGSSSFSISVLAPQSGNYSVTGTSTNGCSTTAIVNLNVNTGCSDVWPGDANSDGTVNGLDVLELGFANLGTGPARTTAGNSWTAQTCNNWLGLVSSGKNKCHADCNGDGTINVSDTLAIHQNFSLSHSFKPAASGTSITLVSDLAGQIIPGQWNKLQVMVADTASPVSIYGLVFDIDYPAAIIEQDSVHLSYIPSFFNSNIQNIEFRKTIFSNAKLHAADVRTNGSDASGYGRIATFYFKVKPDVLPGTAHVFGLSQAQGVHASQQPETFSGNSLTLYTADLLGIKEQGRVDVLSIYPNPASRSFTLRSPGSSPVKYSISDLSGRVILTGEATSGELISTSGISNGVYLLQCSGNDVNASRKLIIQGQ